MNFDLMIIGGGTAGVLAAIKAASKGIRVAIIEQQNVCGGNATLSGLAEFNAATFLKQPLYHGFEQMIFDRLIERQAGQYYYQLPMSSDKDIKVDRLRYNPEVLKLILEELLAENHVRVFYNTDFQAAKKEAAGFTVQATNFGTSYQFSTKYLIDGTSNCLVATSLGCQTQPLAAKNIAVSTQLFRLSNVDLPTLQAFIASGKLSDVISEAFEKNIIQGRILAFAPIPGTNDTSVNVTRTNVDYRDPAQLSQGLHETRSQINRIVGFIKKNIPGCREAYLSNIAPILGVRASVKLDGREMLHLDDIKNMCQFEDCIGVGCYPVDIHDPVTKKVHFLKIDGVYQIPLGVCLPRENLNLAVIGKAISTDMETFAATRVMPIVMNVGESIGAIFAYAVKNSKDVYTLTPTEVKKIMVQEDLVNQTSEVN
ncbi:FAD-dependent oxidoreductase [Lacticaseibacillus zeae]|uniref:FAD-dependent oxidoreductase n=1 Tax=Lacticaseibacillus zeae TaxID=57037 RepID=A0A5R8LNU2_LACZE|nr:FAD-dependent oxidoreductase [Lacticaseibacillus zeae]TLF38850.1 FAD-dependent oxidoreductase [Lacticaseibacillus zeae]